MALEENAMKIIRADAVKQAKKMIGLVESIAATTIKNSVAGETFITKSKGNRMVMAKFVAFGQPNQQSTDKSNHKTLEAAS